MKKLLPLLAVPLLALGGCDAVLPSTPEPETDAVNVSPTWIDASADDMRRSG